jgi:hypothetical protein
MSFKSLVKKLMKEGKSKEAATKIAGSVANAKIKGAGSGPTAKQKARSKTPTKMKKQGYNARLDDSLGAKNGKKKQSMKSRRDESEGMEKSKGNKKFSGNKSSDQIKKSPTKKSKQKVEQDYARNAIADYKAGDKKAANYEKKKALEVAAGESGVMMMKNKSSMMMKDKSSMMMKNNQSGGGYAAKNSAAPAKQLKKLGSVLSKHMKSN